MKLARYLLGGLLLVALGFFTWKMVRLTLPYLSFQRNVDFLLDKQDVIHLDHWRWSFYLHILTSPFLLIGGALQFSPRVLARWPRVHKTSGYLYLISVLLLSGPAGIVMAFYASGGTWSILSFVLLAFTWYGFTLWAFLRIKKGDWQGHSEFMLRSYALTLSAITFRLLIPVFSFYLRGEIDLRPHQIYTLVAWLSWVPNLLVAEWIIRTGWSKRLLRRRRELMPTG